MKKPPVIPENVFLTLQNLVGALPASRFFDSDAHKLADKYTRQGIFAMELLLEIDGKESFRHIVKKNWANERKDEAVLKSLSFAEKIIFRLITFGIPFVVFLIPTILYVFINPDNSPLVQNIITAVFFSFLSGLIAFGVNLFLKKIFRNIYNHRISDLYKNEESQLNEWDLFDSAGDCVNNSSESYLNAICKKIGVDPSEVKLGLGTVRGGGSTFIGWGSGAVVGAAIGLSIGSAAWNGLKNIGKNEELRDLENYIYYNNLAVFFNNEAKLKK